MLISDSSIIIIQCTHYTALTVFWRCRERLVCQERVQLPGTLQVHCNGCIITPAPHTRNHRYQQHQTRLFHLPLLAHPRQLPSFCVTEPQTFQFHLCIRPVQSSCASSHLNALACATTELRHFASVHQSPPPFLHHAAPGRVHGLPQPSIRARLCCLPKQALRRRFDATALGGDCRHAAYRGRGPWCRSSCRFRGGGPWGKRLSLGLARGSGRRHHRARARGSCRGHRGAAAATDVPEPEARHQGE